MLTVVDSVVCYPDLLCLGQRHPCPDAGNAGGSQLSLSCSHGFTLSHGDPTTLIFPSLGVACSQWPSMLEYKWPMPLPQDWTILKIHSSSRAHHGIHWNLCSLEFNPTLCPTLILSLSHWCWPRECSPVNSFHTNLLLRVCFLESQSKTCILFFLRLSLL